MIPKIEVLKLFELSSLTKPDVDLVYSIAENVRKMAEIHGLLALDDVIFEFVHPKLYKDGLKSVINGIDPQDLINRFSESVLKLDNDTEISLAVMYLQCLISLQNGENKHILKMRIAALEGISALSDIIREISAIS